MNNNLEEQVIAEFKKILIKHGKENGLKIIKSKLVKLAVVFSNKGNNDSCQHFLDLVEELNTSFECPKN